MSVHNSPSKHQSPKLSSSPKKQIKCSASALGNNQQSPLLDNDLNLSKGYTIKPSPSNDIIKLYTPIQTPRSEIDEALPLTHSVSSTILLVDSKEYEFEPKPLLSEETDFKSEQFFQLFSKKCQQLSQVLDFTHPDLFFQKIEAKSVMLDDMLKAVSNPRLVNSLTENEYSELINCFIRNNIRITAKPPDQWFTPLSIDFKIDKVEEAGWCHLSMMYEIMISFFLNQKFKTRLCMKQAPSLLRSILLMFQSPDQREREKLSTLFYAFYRTFSKLRNDAREILEKYFTEFILTGEPFICYHELLITLVSIFPGFKIPIHPDHKQFFINALLPLHRSSYLFHFHTALVSVITCLLQKDGNLTPYVFTEIFNYWPYSSPTKQILLLKELELLTDFLNPNDEEKIILQFSNLLARCISDPNFAIAEKAILLWESDSVMRVTKNNAKVMFPIILPQIFKTTYSHWCEDVRSLAGRAMGVLKGINKVAFENVGRDYKQIESERILNEMKKGNTWNSLIHAYCQNEKESNELIMKIGSIFIGCESFSEKLSEKV